MFSLLWPFNLLMGLIRLPFQVVVCLACIFTLAAFRGDQGWLWSLTTHFRPQYLLIQLAALLWVSLRYWSSKQKPTYTRWPHWFTLIFLGFFAGLNLWGIVPYYWPVKKPMELSSKQTVTLLHLNLFGEENQQVETVAQLIRDVKPDMVDLVEYSPRWKKRLEATGVFAAYPYRVAQGAYMGLYSKRPLQGRRLVFPQGQQVANQAYIRARFQLNRQAVSIMVAHPASPIRPSHLNWLQESFQGWAQVRPQLGKNLILVGDLNTSPWSVEFNELLQKMKLRDSQVGFGLQPSWPMLLPSIGIQNGPNWLTRLMMVPIDHVLISPDIQVLSRKTGPFVGSDHLPVIITLSL